MGSLLNFFRQFRINRIFKKWLKSIKAEAAEEILDLLLKGMSLVFLINKDYRRNIKNFNGRYLFRSRDKKISVSAVFENGMLTSSQDTISDPNITVVFKDGKALLNYLFSPKPDILNSLLTQDVTFSGNLNYLYKFAYMATSLRLMAEELVHA